jgi:protein arginine kinase activator
MKCEVCGLKEAVIHIRQIQKEDTHELHICEDCAREKGLIREEDAELPVTNLLAGLLDGPDEEPGASKPAPACTRCGTKLADFRKTGKLGCAACFQTFESDLHAILSQMAARPRHAGRLPSLSAADPAAARTDREGLRGELRAAIESEDYERAALLRDRLREIDGSV